MPILHFLSEFNHLILFYLYVWGSKWKFGSKKTRFLNSLRVILMKIWSHIFFFGHLLLITLFDIIFDVQNANKH
jgi:hypothetical protein